MANYTKVVYSSGHGGKNGCLPGACGNGYKEYEVATKLVNKIYNYHNRVGTAYKFHDTSGTNISSNISNIVTYHNSKSRSLDVSVHLNSSTNKSATGAEVLYYSSSGKDIATRVSKVIANTLGITNRGAKQRTDLGFLKKTDKPAILLEICFISNSSDMSKLMKGADTTSGMLNKLAKAIVEEITGKDVPSVTSTTTTTSTTTSSSSSSSATTHTVKSGDTLYSISKKYGCTVKEIQSWNNMGSKTTLTIGTKLIVSNVKTHTVKSGDTLYAIAKKYNTTVSKIKEWNNLKSNTLSIGQTLIVSK